MTNYNFRSTKMPKYWKKIKVTVTGKKGIGFLNIC